jgi:biotin carboxyl carrier protein
MTAKTLHYKGNPFVINLNKKNDHHLAAEINEETLEVMLHEIDGHTLSIVHDNHHYMAYFAVDATQIYVVINGEQYIFEKPQEQKTGFRPGLEAASGSGNEICAPMPGKIFKIFVKEGQKIDRNGRLFIVEAMKMENEVKSSRAGVVKKVNFKENDLVSVGDVIIEFES